MSFKKRLIEALGRNGLVQLDQIDKRLKTNSDFVPIGTGLERSAMFHSGVGPVLAPGQVHSNLRRDKVPLSDDRNRSAVEVISELLTPEKPPLPTQKPQMPAPEQGMPAPGGEEPMADAAGAAAPPEAGIDPNEITDADLPPREGEGGHEQAPAPENIPGTPSGNKYSVDTAMGQLEGILKNWMLMAGEFPEGEQKHNFIEIGERLREISGVLERDFGQQPSAPASIQPPSGSPAGTPPPPQEAGAPAPGGPPAEGQPPAPGGQPPPAPDGQPPPVPGEEEELDPNEELPV